MEEVELGCWNVPYLIAHVFGSLILTVPNPRITVTSILYYGGRGGGGGEGWGA